MQKTLVVVRIGDKRLLITYSSSRVLHIHNITSLFLSTISTPSVAMAVAKSCGNLLFTVVLVAGIAFLHTDIHSFVKDIGQCRLQSM